VSLAALAARLLEGRARVLSSDVFDTLLLRDGTSETARFAEVGRLAAAELRVDPAALARLRWLAHDAAYRGVALQDPTGDAALTGIHRSMVAALGLPDSAAEVLRRTELAVDAAHLRPNTALLRVLLDAAASGTRLLVLSDTYYGETDLRTLLHRLVGGALPLSAVYSSADLNATKHSGAVFPIVTGDLGVDPAAMLHVGDHPRSDVRMPRAAGWTAVHLPRTALFGLRRSAGRLTALRQLGRRAS
jgi:FMN phosphatase YigB (HAD superfamily)